MSIFSPDTSIQITGDSTLTKTYSSKDNPNLAFHSRAGIYNSANNEIKFFTNGVDALTIDANQKVICNGSLITNINYNNIDGKPTLFSGAYNDLTGKPTLFSGAYNDLTGKPTLFSGAYNDLTGKPTLFSGSYNDLTSKPTLATVATSGLYDDLLSKPTLFSGSYNDLTSKPTLATVATSGLYNDLLSKPTLFSGSYNDLTSKPTLFSGSYNDLTSKPTLATVATSGLYDDLLSKPTLFSGSYNDLTSKPTLATVATSGLYNDLLSKPTLFSGSYNDLTSKPTLATVATSGLYNDLLSKPTLFSGSYNDLIGKPDIFTKTETSNIFVTSNVLSNTSNNLFQSITSPVLTNYFTKVETSNIFTTSNHIQNSLNFINYNNLNNRPWISSGTNIYNSNIGNVGIGTTIPICKLDVNGEIYSTSNINIGNIPLKFINSFSNSTLMSVAGTNETYLQYTGNGTLNLNEPSACDILVVGAGGNGGINSWAGGGGAGEVIYYPNYIFNSGLYNINVGVNSLINSSRISSINSGQTAIISAQGGSHGAGFITSMLSNTSNYVLSYPNCIFNYNNNNLFSNIPIGTYDFIINKSAHNVIASNVNTSSIISYTINPTMYINNTNSIPSEHRIYPPKAYNTSSSTTTATLTGRTVKSGTFNLTTAGISYGSGTYQLYFSDDGFMGVYGVNYLFDRDTNINGVGSQWNTGYWTNGSFVGPNTTYLVPNYIGSWLVIKLPVAIVLKWYRFIPRFGHISRCPGEWKLYGSLDGNTFTEIEYGSTTSSQYNGTNSSFTRNTSNENSYLYYGFAIRKLAGTDILGGQFNMIELELYGYEITPTVYVNNTNSIPSEHKQFPPKAYNTSSSTTTATLTGRTVKSGTFNLTTAGISYGSGTYQLYFSDDGFMGVYGVNYLFNRDISDGTVGSQWDTGYWTNGSFVGANTTYLVPNYIGSWLVIKLPVAIVLKWYRFIPRFGHISRCPGEWKLYGSLDGNTFTEIEYGSTTTLQYNGTNSSFTRNTNNQTSYLYYGFAIGKLVGTDAIAGQFNMMELELYGYESPMLPIEAINIFSVAEFNSGGLTSSYFNIASNAGIVVNKWNDKYSYYISGFKGTFDRGGNGGGALYTIGYTSLITGNSLIFGEGGTGATFNSIPILKQTYGSGGDGNGGLGTQGIIIIRFKEPLYLQIKGIKDNANSGLIVNANENNDKYQLRLYPFTDIFPGFGQTVRGYSFRTQHGNNSTDLFNLFSSFGGRVGIKTKLPYATLDVNGDINCKTFFVNGDEQYGILCQITNQNAIGESSLVMTAGQGTNYGNLSIVYLPSVNLGFINCSKSLQIKTARNGSYIYIDDTTGNVGIGLTNPQSKLELVGDINSTSMTCSTGNMNSISTYGIALNNGNITGVNKITSVEVQTGPVKASSLDLNGGNITNGGFFYGMAQQARFLNMSTNEWHYDTQSRNRFYFTNDGTSSHTVFRTGSTSHYFQDKDATDYAILDRYGGLSTYHEVVSGSGYDNICVLDASVTGVYVYRRLLVRLNSFTEIHRVFVEDDLFINYDDFINEFVGRVVVSTGKIKQARKEIDKEWEVLQGKDGIMIDDAQCVVQLSRKRKDKAIYGIITKRNKTDFPNRICVNGLGEGGIYVINTNGNLENGDYLQTSDELGYAEKQCDDILHNYTIAKVVMDCTFELDNLNYKCEVIDAERNLRRAFLACVYYCG